MAEFAALKIRDAIQTLRKMAVAEDDGMYGGIAVRALNDGADALAKQYGLDQEAKP